MLSDGLQGNSLEKYHSNEPLIRETAEQVIKDFGLFEMVVTFRGDQGTPYDELFGQVLPHIRSLMEHENARLHALMYQIDIPESWWARIRREHSPDAVARGITDAILQRELFKVITRNHYRQRRL
ncbi:MAG TPA: hypothetical protein P5550_12630 [Bacteroidales bacterium]|nr:hypothetical protein [Bacteroidales bacterium]HRZ76067.1 hypothetical protein [Bacteroidales bacterium]